MLHYSQTPKMSSSESRPAEAICRAASALDGEARTRYLDQHCPDPEIRRQVESMLAAVAALTLETGGHIGRYEIVARLGAGGMGTVYEVRDPRLNRPAAIKVLSPAKIEGGHVHGSLLREAQAASALNHPNIVTVYEIASEGGLDYIAMEHITGETLVKKIRHGMELREALTLAAQIADALAAAHAAGIVHRDLKPGNVMVTDRGLVKVLDFGLAKRFGPDAAGFGDTVTATMTAPGRVFGTVAYMSPEQAQGKEVDGRSDVFAFGSVLYEMVTGKRAFQEEGDLPTLAAVLKQEPRPPHELHPGLPREVERIIENCLRKNRAERWHSMADVKLLIEDAVRELGAPPAAAAPIPRRGRLAGLALAALGGMALIGAVWFLMRTPPPEPVPVLRRITTDPGLSAFPSFSRDGNLLAYASDRGHTPNLDIWLQQIGGQEPIQLTHDSEDDTDPDISPDGTRVVFRAERAGGGIYAMPALGGGGQVLLAPGGRNPRVSPDGRSVAYWEGQELGGYLPGSARVWVVDATGGTPRQLGTDLAAALHPVWSPKGDALLVLGKGMHAGALDAAPDWWLVPLSGAASKKTGVLARLHGQRLFNAAWQLQILPLVWRNAPRSRVLFAAGYSDATGSGDVANLWEIALDAAGQPDGSATRLTAGPSYQLQAAVAAGSDRGRMAVANLDWKVGVWTVDLDAESGVVRDEYMTAMTGKESYAMGPSLSRDGRVLAFLSRRLGRWGLHTRELASGRELTVASGEPTLGLVRISGDGKSAIYSDIAGSIFSVPREGGKVMKFCDRCGHPTDVTFDGGRICFEPLREEALTVLDAAGKTTILAERPAETVLSGGRWSPDEKWMTFHSVESRTGTTRVWIARIDGKLPVPPGEWIAVTDGRSVDRDAVWSPGANLLYFLSERDGFRCVWAVRLDAARRPVGTPFAVRHFHSASHSLQRIPGGADMIGLSVAPGRLVLAFGELTGNIWMEEKPR